MHHFLAFCFSLMKCKMRRRESKSVWCTSMLSMLSLRTPSLLPLNHALFWTRAQIQSHYSSSPPLPSSSPLICGLALITTGENDIPTWAHYNVWYVSFTESYLSLTHMQGWIHFKTKACTSKSSHANKMANNKNKLQQGQSSETI